MNTPVTRPFRRSSRAGFSLVEMIGVLAIIAILAVVIVPKVFSTIASSRITHAVGSVNSMKTAVTEFAGKYGTLPTTNNNSRIDNLLYTAGMLEGPFVLKIGTAPNPNLAAPASWANTNGTWAFSGGANQTSQSRVICRVASGNNPSVNTSNNLNFRLDGVTNIPAGSRVVATAIPGATAAEARELSLRIDGEMFTEADTSTADDNGRVVYNTPNGAGLTTVYIYLAHQ